MADGGKVIIKIDGDDKGLKKSTESSKTQAAKLAAEFKKQGMSQSEAMKKAWDEVGRTSKEKSEKVKDDIDGIGDKAKETGEKISKHIGTGFNKAANIAKTAAKAIAVGVGAAATAIGAIGTQAVKAYADYEQLVGGVETLFKQNADVVQNYANQAYQTAGMSANQYMETVTSFSASLLQSLGGDTAKAAEYGNQAVIDMSDNANKMGTSIEMIQNAYQGFAKQNYTMLDNLKLGYGGTKEEMQRLVNDAAKLDSGIKANDLSFSNIVKSIHAVQTQMGITGTTAEEAATTIQGSLGMVKASWENLLTGLADPNADIDLLMDNVINSVMTFGENLEPVIEAVLEKIPIMIDTLGEQIIQKLPGVINTILPSLVNTAAQLITTLSDTLNNNATLLSDTALNILMTLVNALISNLPILLNAAITLAMALAKGLTDSLPELINTAVDMIFLLVDTLLDNIDQLIDVGINLILSLADGLIQALPKLIEKAPEIIQKLVNAIINNAPKLSKAAGQLIGKLAAGIVMNLPQLIGSAIKIVLTLVKYLKWYFTDYIPSVGINIVKGIWQGISSNAQWLWKNLKKWCKNVVDKIKGYFGIHSPSRVMRDEVGKMITEGIAVGIEEATPTLEEAIKNQKQAIVDNYKEIAQAAIDKIDEVLKAEESFAKKLKDFGSLYNTNKIVSGDGETEFISLADIKSQTYALEKYADTLLAVKARGNVSKEFFANLRDMSVEEGTKFAEALLLANDDTFNAYMNDWQEKQNVSDELSKLLYADEAENAKDEITSSFEEFDTDLTEQGKQNAQSWGEGFIEQIKQIMPNVKAAINSAFGDIVLSRQYALAGAGDTTSNTYNSNYYVQSADGESTQKQLWNIRNAEFLKKQRGY